MRAEALRLGDVFSLPGVVRRGPFRVLRASEQTSMVRVAICDPAEDTAYPVSEGRLKAARALMLWPDLLVVVHARNQF